MEGTVSTFDPSSVQAVLFDVDGTLRETDDELVARIARRLGPLSKFLPGRDATRAARRIVMRMESPANLLLAVPNALGIARGVNATVERLVRARADARHAVVSGVAGMLQTLKGSYVLGVVSAGLDRDTRQFLTSAGIAADFGAVATLGTCARTKPRADPVLWAARELGIPSERCVMVGDTTVDIRAGRAAGAQTIGVLCGFGEEAELRAAGADLIISSTAALVDVLSC